MGILIGNILTPRYVPKDDAILLEVKAGLFDFSYNKPARWVFADGTESVESRPTRTLDEAQFIKLYTDDYAGILSSNSTNRNYIGSPSSLSKLTYYLNLGNTDFSGKLEQLSHLTYGLIVPSCKLEGDIKHLSTISRGVDLSSNTNIYGSISSLKNIESTIKLSNTEVSGDLGTIESSTLQYIYLTNTDVYGVLNVYNDIVYLHVAGTKMSSDDTLDTLRVLNVNITGTKSRALQFINNINLEDPEVVTIVNNLVSKGCLISFV